MIKKSSRDFKERGNKYSKWMKRGVGDVIKKRRKRAKWHANERRVHGNDIIPGNSQSSPLGTAREKHDSTRWRRVVLSFVPLSYIHHTEDDPRKNKSPAVLVKRVDEASIYYITKLLVPRKGHHVVASYCFQRVHSLLPRDENSWPEDTRVLEFAREDQATCPKYPRTGG